MLSQEWDRWSVKFDVWDLGGHSDATFRGWSATLVARVRLVIARLVLIFALPLDFHRWIGVVKSTCLPAALHGIEASLLASDTLRGASFLYSQGGIVSSSAFGQCWCCTQPVGWAYWV